MMNQPSMRVMSKEYMLAHAGECVAISNDGLSFEAVVCGGGGGGGVTDITYAALVTAIGASGLTAGAQYRITDYATVHYIVDAGGTQYLDSIITGVNEPLIVTASSSNTLEPVAYSALHPEDIIYYDFNPVNWLDDLSFADLSGTPTIIAGFKGVIYFRHDTLLDNYMGYDFRNCRFRRWQADIPDWSDATTYAKGDFVRDDVYGLFRSLIDGNINNAPQDEPDKWINLSAVFTGDEYINNRPDATNGIISSATFDDFLTFSESGGATYAATVRANHFEPFKDKNAFDESSGSILSNNVFFLQTASYYTVYTNEIAGEFVNNTFIDTFETNDVGSSCVGNIFFTGAFGNTIGSYFMRNLIAQQFIHNNISNRFFNCCVGVNFCYNNFSNECRNLIAGNTFQYNTIGNYCQDITAAQNFKQNTLQDKVSGVDLLTATHVYADYNTTIFIRVDGTAKLSYCDNSDVIQVVNANA